MENTNDEQEILFPDDIESSLTDEQKEKDKELQDVVDDFIIEEETEDDSEDNEGTDDNPSHDRDSSSPSIVTPLAQTLREKGILQSLKEEDIEKLETVEDFIEALVKDRNESMYQEMNESQKKYFDGLKAGIPEEEIKFDLKREETYESLTDEDLEDEQVQFQLVLNDLLSNGIDEAKAKRLALAARTAGTLKEDAVDSLTSLKNKAKSALQEKIRAKNEEALEEKKKKEIEAGKLKDSIYNADEIIKNYKMNDLLKEKLFTSMTKIVEMDGKTPLNEVTAARKKNPVEFDKKLHLAYILTNGFEDFTSLSQKAKTGAINELKETLEKGGQLKGKGSKVPLSESTSELLKKMRTEGIK